MTTSHFSEIDTSNARATLTLGLFFGKGYKNRTYRASKHMLVFMIKNIDLTTREYIILDQIFYTGEWLLATGRVDGHVEIAVTNSNLKDYFKKVVLPAYKESVKRGWLCSADMSEFVKKLLYAFSG